MMALAVRLKQRKRQTKDTFGAAVCKVLVLSPFFLMHNLDGFPESFTRTEKSINVAFG